MSLFVSSVFLSPKSSPYNKQQGKKASKMQEIFLITKLVVVSANAEAENPLTRPKPIKPKPKPTGSGPNKPKIALYYQES